MRPAALLLLFFFFILILQPGSAWAQDSSASDASFAEKVYLQPDNKVYTTDQAIWFKAIVANAAYHTPSQISGVLYVELIDANENIIERKLIKLVDGKGEGFFQLSPLYSYGTYQLRAYTEWNKNFGTDFFFKEYILIFGAEKKEATFEPIKKVTIIEGQRNQRRLNVEVDPSMTDSLSGKGIRFVLDTKGKKDTIAVKRNRSNQYLLDYLIPASSDLLTVQVEMDNAINYGKTIILDTTYIDLQFFPESGELVHGLPALVGFKALDYEGRGKNIEGEIINTKGEVVTSFNTNSLGMGALRLATVDSAAKYTARVSSPTGSKQYSLPPVADKGNSLSVQKTEDKIMIKASSNYLTGDSVKVRASCRGILYFDFAGRLKNGSLEFGVKRSMLPEGIINFTLLLTPSMIPVAERLCFNERPEERVQISVSLDKNEYLQRDKTEVGITTHDQDGQPIPASISLMAIHQSPQDTTVDFRQNILSFFLLNSDLKGVIEKPGYYFVKGADRSHDLDVLLLTQGWSKYNYTRTPAAFNHAPEPNLTVSGIVKGGLSAKKTKDGAELTLMTSSKPPFFSNGRTDSLGRFRFLMDDQYGDNVDVLIQSADKANKNKPYVVTLDKKDVPPVVFEHARSVQKPDSIVQAYIKQSIEQKKIEDAYAVSTEGITLKEVIVTGRILSPEQKEVTDKYGEAKTVISGKEIQAKEEKWSYGLYSVLLFNFPDQVRITRYPGGMLYASLHNPEFTLVVIDGITVKIEDYSLIPIIPPSEVKSFELIPYAKNWHSLFCEVFPRACGMPGEPPFGNVIAIYTHAGKGIHGTKAPVGISKMVVPVFSPLREFYAPRYEQLNPDDWKKPDLRNLVHWDPKLATDSTGKAAVTFYNGDNTGAVRIVVEAISKDGQIGYSELLYDVRSRNLKATAP